MICATIYYVAQFTLYKSTKSNIQAYLLSCPVKTPLVKIIFFYIVFKCSTNGPFAAAMSMFVYVPFPVNLFWGLSLALRSYDQFQASPQTPPPSEPPPLHLIFNFFDMQKVYLIGICDSIRIGQVIRCLRYARFLFSVYKVPDFVLVKYKLTLCNHRSYSTIFLYLTNLNCS